MTLHSQNLWKIRGSIKAIQKQKPGEKPPSLSGVHATWLVIPGSDNAHGAWGGVTCTPMKGPWDREPWWQRAERLMTRRLVEPMGAGSSLSFDGAGFQSRKENLLTSCTAACRNRSRVCDLGAAARQDPLPQMMVSRHWIKRHIDPSWNYYYYFQADSSV